MKGFNYCSLDTGVFSDIKVRKLRRRCGFGAAEIFIAVLCDIYRNGYYVTCDEDYKFIVADTLGCDEAKVGEVLDGCLEFGLFDLRQYEENGILTSRGIQSRFKEMGQISRRKADIEEYNLLENCTKTGSNCTKSTPNCTIQGSNCAILTENVQNAPENVQQCTNLDKNVQNAISADFGTSVSGKNNPKTGENDGNLPEVGVTQIEEIAQKGGQIVQKTEKLYKNDPKMYNDVQKGGQIVQKGNLKESKKRKVIKDIYKNYYYSFSSLSSFSFLSEKEQPEKQQQKEFLSFLADFFFRNYDHPEKELKKCIAYNKTGGRKWDKWSLDEKESCLSLWRQTDPKTGKVTDPQRFAVPLLDAWRAVVTELVNLDAPAEIIADSLSDKLSFNANNLAKTFTISYPKGSQMPHYIEEHGENFSPMFRTLREASACGTVKWKGV